MYSYFTPSVSGFYYHFIQQSYFQVDLEIKQIQQFAVFVKRVLQKNIYITPKIKTRSSIANIVAIDFSETSNTY
jgi:hypothetical protein